MLSSTKKTDPRIGVHPSARACELRKSRVRSRSFWRATGGFAAAEVALLALLFIGMSLMVARIIRPGIKAAATNLNQELAGGISK